LQNDPAWQAKQAKERAAAEAEKTAKQKAAADASAKAAETAAKDKSLHGGPKVGSVYRASRNFPGVFNKNDSDEVIKRLRSDPGSLVELVLQGRVADVPEGAEVKVIDMTGFMDVWVQVRRIDEPGIRTFWIPADALEKL
jgi:hypothetical protein